MSSEEGSGPEEMAIRRLVPAELRQQLHDDRMALEDGLDRATAAVGVADRARLRWIAWCDNAELWREDGCRNTAQWVAQTLGISKWKARRWIAAGHALEALPYISLALERGTLSLDKIVELTRFATSETEEKLVKWARRVTPAGIRERADRATAVTIQETTAVEELRSLTHWWDIEGRFLRFEGMLPAASGATFVAALDRLADELPDLPGEGGRDRDREATIDQRRADALVLMASGHAAGASDAGRATVVVHAPIEALTADHGNCHLDNGLSLHPEVVRRLSCDGRLQTVLHDGGGKTVGIGRTSEDVPEWLRQEVFHRDSNVCTFINCDHRRYLHAHHIEHWSRGGYTDLDNLLTVCWAHHSLVHEHRWSVTRSDNGVVTWFRPSGRIYAPGTDPPTHQEVETLAPHPEPPHLIEARRYSPLFAFPPVPGRRSRARPPGLRQQRARLLGPVPG